MSTPRIRVHVREKPDRKNLQLYYVDPLTGDDVTKSAGTADHKEAERAAARWEEELAAQKAKSDPSWERFRERYEDEQLSSLADSTGKTAASVFNSFERVVGKPRRISAIDASVLSQCAAAWRRDGLAETTIAGNFKYLLAALNWGVRVGLLDRAPRPPRINLPHRTMRGRPLTVAESRHILRVTPDVVGEAWRGWVRFQHALWLSGLRLSEAVALSWDAGPVRVDLDGGRRPMLIFRAEGQKSRRDERVPITPDFAKWLARTPREKRHGPVLPVESVRGGLIAAERIGDVLADIGTASGVVVSESGKHASAHDWRRTFGTRWAARVKPLALKTLMRHKSIETTLKYYVDQDADDIADQLWE